MACVEHDITFTCIYALVNKIILKKLRIQSWIRLCFQNICFKVLKLLSKLSKEFPQYNCITFLLLLSCYTSHIATLFSYSKNIFFPFFFFSFYNSDSFFFPEIRTFLLSFLSYSNLQDRMESKSSMISILVSQQKILLRVLP